METRRLSLWIALICAACSPEAAEPDDQISETFLSPANSTQVIVHRRSALDVVAENIGGLTTDKNGASASFTVALASAPTADVTVAITSSDEGAGTVTSGAGLTFTSTNWATPRTVVVTGVDDEVASGPQTYFISMTSGSLDSAYNGISRTLFRATNNDVHHARVKITSAGLTTTSSGGTASFTIELTSKPTASVTVPLTSSDITKGTISPASVTFSTANWQTPVTATLTGVATGYANGGSTTYHATIGPNSTSDTLYGALPTKMLRVTNTDANIASVLVTTTGGLTTTYQGGTASFSVVLTCQPRNDVTIGISTDAPTQGNPNLTSVTFTSANWSTPRNVTITGADSGLYKGNISYRIAFAAAVSADAAYNGIVAPALLVTNIGRPLSNLSIEDAPLGNGFPVGARALPEGQRLPLYAVYRAVDNGTYAGAANVTWSATGLGAFSSATGSATTFIPNAGSGTATVSAALASYTTATTGTLTISYSILSIAGLRMWLKADALLGAANGSTVAAWTDHSPFATAVTQTTAGNRPTFVTGAVNDYPTVRFNGSSQFMIFNNINTVRTVFLVIKHASGYRAGSADYVLGCSAFNNFNMSFYGDFGSHLFNPLSTAGVLGGAAYVNGVSQAVLGVQKPTTYSVVSLVTSANSVTSALGAVYTNGYFNHWEGDIVEVALFTTALSDTDRQTVEGYLNDKYDLDGTDSAAPTLLGTHASNATTVTAYFGEQLDAASATHLANYSLNGGATVSAAALSSDNTKVTLTTSSLTPGTTYTLTVNNVKDRFDHAIASNTTSTFDWASLPSTGRVQWFRADGPLVKDASNNVSRWIDVSGQANDAMQAAYMTRPTYAAAAANGKPVVRFGTSHGLSFGYRNDIRTSIVVVKHATGTSIGADSILGSNMGDNFLLDYNGAAGPLLFHVTNTAASVRDAAAYVNGRGAYVPAISKPVTYSIVSLVTTASTATSALGVVATHGYHNFWNGDIAEVMLFNTALSDADRETIEAYLKAKWQGGTDSTAPTLLGTHANTSTSVKVYFSEQMEAATAGSVGNYAINNGVTISGVTLAADRWSATLATSALSTGTTYTLTVNNIRDMANNTIAPGSTSTFDWAALPATGLSMWLRADGPLVKDGSNNITRWLDMAAQGNDATQIPALGLPTYVAGAVNGKPVARFSDDGLAFANRADLRTAFLVIRHATGTTAAGSTVLGSNMAHNFSLDWIGPTGTLMFGAAAAAAITAGSGWVNSVSQAIGSIVKPTTYSLISVVTSANANASAIGSVAMHGHWGIWAGDVAEAVLYNTALDATDRGTVETYLRTKYALP